jgi:hypothetical protein
VTFPKWMRIQDATEIDRLRSENKQLWTSVWRLSVRIAEAESKVGQFNDLRRIVVDQRLELYRLNKIRAAENTENARLSEEIRKLKEGQR